MKLDPAIQSAPSNGGIAGILRELADLLEAQSANPFRIRAYRQAADAIANAPISLGHLALTQPQRLQEIPGIGPSIGHAIETISNTGKLPLLNKLKGDASGEWLLQSIPTVGAKMAHRLHDELGIESYEDLQTALSSGRLQTMRGLGAKRLRAIAEFLSARDSHRNGTPTTLPPQLAHLDEPEIAELLDIDREYREKARAGELPRIAPRRLNPSNEAWLPVLHADREDRHYTALFSNTAHAHDLGMTRDWVVIYLDHPNADKHQNQWTVITSQYGKLRGLRIVRGREWECDRYYARDRLKDLLSRLKQSGHGAAAQH